MIFNDDLIFIHIGKTGGMSCSDYLLHNLRPPVYNCHYEARNDMNRIRNVDGIVPTPDINRHCTLAEALAFIFRLNGRRLKDFARVVAVVRHPYTLEYSFYKHLQKPHVRERRKNDTDLLELADNDFKTFVEKAPYHRKNHPQDAFFRLGDGIPDCVTLVRFEELSAAFPDAVSPFLRKRATYPFPHTNRTGYESDIRRELTDDVKALIYQKHRFMFDSGIYAPV